MADNLTWKRSEHAQGRILVIDRDLSWTLQVSETLIGDEYAVFSANSPQDAFLLLEAHNFDLIIAEVNMPDVDGTAFSEQLRQIYPTTMMIISNQQWFDRPGGSGNQVGVFDYLEKTRGSQLAWSR